MLKATHDHIHRISSFGVMSQTSNKHLTSIAEETPKHVALKFRSNAEFEPSEAHTELIFLLRKINALQTQGTPLWGSHRDGYVSFPLLTSRNKLGENGISRVTCIT